MANPHQIKQHHFDINSIYLSLMIAKIFVMAIIGISNALVTDFSEEITSNIFKNSITL